MYQLNQLTNRSQFGRNSINRAPWRRGFLLRAVVLVVAWLTLSLQARAACLQGCGSDSSNTFLGDDALMNNTGSFNTAIGSDALSSNTTGNFNTAVGYTTLLSNTTGIENTATGYEALTHNTGNGNTAVGSGASGQNTAGQFNTASGNNALYSNTAGSNNTAAGHNALFNSTGGNNIALGESAGSNINTGSNDIDIGNVGVAGAAEVGVIRVGTTQTKTFVAGIWNQPVPGANQYVRINASGKLGTVPSSARFKEAIKPMDKTSEAILALRPVTFRYKKELDPEKTAQFGLVAEEVEKVSPDLVIHDEKGKPYSVRYEAVDAMLLNEFLKEHRKVESLEASVAKLQSVVQKVSNQMELTKSAPQVVSNH